MFQRFQENDPRILDRPRRRARDGVWRAAKRLRAIGPNLGRVSPASRRLVSALPSNARPSRRGYCDDSGMSDQLFPGFKTPPNQPRLPDYRAEDDPGPDDDPIDDRPEGDWCRAQGSGWDSFRDCPACGGGGQYDDCTPCSECDGEGIIER